MKFMSKIWALLALIGMCSFGLPAAAHTATDTVACMKAGLAAEPFTGSYKTRLKQARHLPIDTVQVLVNDTWKPLPAGGSLWQLCEGPTLEEQLATANATISNLEARNSALTTEVRAFKQINQYSVAQLKKASVALQDGSKSAHKANFWIGLLSLGLIFALMFIIMTSYGRRARVKDAKRKAKPARDTSEDTALDVEAERSDNGTPRHPGQH